MSSWNGDSIVPDPREIAAYGDGELNSQLAPLRRKVEKWLASHPEAAEELDVQRRLAEVWLATTPSEPDDAVWNRVAARLAQVTRAAPSPQRRLKTWPVALWSAGLLSAAAAVVWIVLTFLPSRAGREIAVKQPAPPEPRVTVAIEVLEVATADEVEIVRVGGADTGTLVIGEPPVQGMLPLVERGEFVVTRLQPAHDNVLPEVRGADPSSGANPMIWTRLPGQSDQP
jgi:anti-sigma factor RsiW